MNTIIFDFYTGYEGEGEIQFIEQLANKNKNIIRIWDGYFDDIMEKIKPEADGWISLAYYYNLAEGWYEESPWEILHLQEALKQLKQLEYSQFRFEKSKEVLKQVCILLKNAFDENNIVYIARE